MQFPQRGIDIIEGILARKDNLSLSQGTEDDRRVVTRRIAEQLCYELNSRWGTKRADSSRPPSKDALAFLSVDGRLLSWDWQNGETKQRQVQAGQEAEDITGQVFISVSPVNHLESAPPAIPTEDEDNPPVLIDFEEEVRALRERMVDLLASTGILKQDVDRLINGINEQKETSEKILQALLGLKMLEDQGLTKIMDQLNRGFSTRLPFGGSIVLKPNK